jgi:hypothetical protein
VKLEINGGTPGTLHGWEQICVVQPRWCTGRIAAFRDRDLERFLRYYAADVKIRDFDGNVLMDRPEAMRGQYGPLFRDSPRRL